MKTPKKDGGQRIDKGIRHFEPSEKLKEERKDNWDIMFKQPWGNGLLRVFTIKNKS